MKVLPTLNGNRELYTLQTPCTVTWQVTSVCNYNCRFCYGAYGETISKHPDIAIVNKILEELIAASVFELKLSGGEITIFPLLPNLLEKAFSANMSLGLITNGRITPNSILEAFKKYDVSVAISLHGPSAAIHDSICRKSGAFNSAIETAKRHIAHGIPVHIMYGPIHNNFDKTFDTIKMLVSENIVPDYFQVHRISPCGSATSLKGIDTLEMAHYISILEDFVKIENSFGVACEITDAMPFCLIEKQYHKYIHSCPYGHTAASISSTGDLTTCPCSHIPLGNILETPLMELWNNEQALCEFRAFDWIDKKCKQCNSLDKCLAGCRHSRLGDHLFSTDRFLDNT